MRTQALGGDDGQVGCGHRQRRARPLGELARGVALLEERRHARPRTLLLGHGGHCPRGLAVVHEHLLCGNRLAADREYLLRSMAGGREELRDGRARGVLLGVEELLARARAVEGDSC
jgi:hypothetical protein